MKLKNRLFAAFFIIILLPCSMIGTIGSVILAQQVKSMEETYRVETDGWEVVTEPVQILNRMTRPVFNELSTMADRYPERFLDTQRMKAVNEGLLERYSYLLVEREEEMLFVGNEFHYDSIRRQIPDVGGFEVAYDGGIYVGGDVPFLVKQQNFTYEDGEAGSFYIITDVNSMVLRLKSAATVVIFGSILTIVFTAGNSGGMVISGNFTSVKCVKKGNQAAAGG